MPVIHKDLYQVLDSVADGVDTHNIDVTHPWMQGAQPAVNQKWAWHPADNEPVLVETHKVWDETAGAFVDDDTYLAGQLSTAKTARITYLTKCAESAIQGGISCNSLGTMHNYDTRMVDQLNLDNAERYAELNTNPQSGDPSAGTARIRCNDPSGSLGFTKREHTVAQIKQVRADFHVHRETQSDTLETKIGEVNAATTVAGVNAIDW